MYRHLKLTFSLLSIVLSCCVCAAPLPDTNIVLEVPTVSEVPQTPQFSAHPTTSEISRARVFEEPLLPLWEEPLPEENRALADAILAFAKRSKRDDFSPFVRFLSSPVAYSWYPAVSFALGWEYYHTGYYSKAIDAWEDTWTWTQYERAGKAKALADRAAGELARMHARIGGFSRLETLLDEIGDRKLSGSASEKITGAKQALWLMQNKPEISFRCGPLALKSVCRFLDPAPTVSPLLLDAASTIKGVSLRELKALAASIDFDARVVRRAENSEFPLPSVVHWKVGHYAALLKTEIIGSEEFFWVVDPTFGDQGMWISREALEEESSGYFLIPGTEIPVQFSQVEDSEAAEIYGKGVTTSSNPNFTTPQDLKANPDCVGGSAGMAVHSFHLMLVSLNIEDTPLSFQPPRGMPIEFTVTYNQREANQPFDFSYSNFGQKWTCNWLSYVTDSGPSLVGDVQFYVGGGGTETFYYNVADQSYDVQQRTQTRLVRTSSTSYEMVLPDGSRKIFSQPDGTVGSTRKVFLTHIVDSTGYTNQLHYDNRLRLALVTDPAAGVTNLTFHYNSNPLAGSELTIRKVTDRYGRDATFRYDGLGYQLQGITDVIGLTSDFVYSGSFIKTLKTPYGDTEFAYGEDGRTRWIESTDPTGGRSRVEYSEDVSTVPSADPGPVVPDYIYRRNSILNARNTFYWDKKAMREASGDYSKARIYHWLHGNDGASAIGTLESYKEPLENRVWFNYPGQWQQDEGATYGGSLNLPSRIARVLDDGTTQLWQFIRNSIGQITIAADPIGRQFTFVYSTNLIDLLEIRQTRGTDDVLLANFTYNAQHLPVTATDAARQTTKFGYNSFGQLTSITNALQQVTSYSYDSIGRLTNINGALSGSSDSISFTYDSKDRVRTVTDSDGYTVTTDYDDFGRPLTNSFPDQTYESFVYTNLDLAIYRDRAGRVVEAEYTPVRQLREVRQATNWITRFTYCQCGSLESVIDPLGQVTSWFFDVQGRVTGKENADGTQITYGYEATTSRLRTIENERGQTKTNVWNVDDQLVAVLYEPGSLTTNVYYEWDPKYTRLEATGTGTSISNLTGVTSFEYYPVTTNGTLGANQLRKTDNWFSNTTVDYAYDALGRLNSESTSVTEGGQSGLVYTVARSFDALGRVLTATSAMGSITYGYEGASDRLATVTAPHGVISAYDYYDKFGDFLLKDITETPGAGVTTRFNYSYNKAGQITNWVQVQAGITNTYSLGYDGIGQLTNARLTINGTASDTNVFGYDLAGNRTSIKKGGSTWNTYYNPANEITGKDTGQTAIRSFEWDQENRLVAVIAGNTRKEYIYNEFGRCVEIRELTNGSVTKTRTLTWAGDTLVQERLLVNNQAGYKAFHREGHFDFYNSARMFYARDHLGSVREMISQQVTFSLQSRYQYDLFGNKTVLLQNADPAINPVHSFAGLYESGSQLLALHRAYDPDLGRWLSRDPIGESGGLNLYRYANNDPVNFSDPSGLCPDERGFAGRGGQYRDPNSGIIKDGNGIPLKDQLNPFNPENSWNRGISARGGHGPSAKRPMSLLPARSPWPGNSGFIEGTVERKFLMPGDIIDRYGFGGGRFVSPAGTSLQARALRPGTEKLPFNTYRVTKPIEVNSGGVQPWFGQPGLAAC